MAMALWLWRSLAMAGQNRCKSGTEADRSENREACRKANRLSTRRGLKIATANVRRKQVPITNVAGKSSTSYSIATTLTEHELTSSTTTSAKILLNFLVDKIAKLRDSLSHILRTLPVLPTHLPFPSHYGPPRTDARTQR